MGGKELAVQGTPIECIEEDGDNTLIACSKDELNISSKKKFNKSLFQPVIGLGLSQQCKRANREMIHRAHESIHYDHSESLDLVVKATAMFINEDTVTISHRFIQLFGFLLCLCLVKFCIYEVQ